MAVTVSGLRKYTTTTAADGTWLKINLPRHACSVQVEVDGAAYVDGPGGGHTDGASRSSGGRATTVGEVVTLPIPSSASGVPIWVAGNGASRAVTVIAFGSEAR